MFYINDNFCFYVSRVFCSSAHEVLFRSTLKEGLFILSRNAQLFNPFVVHTNLPLSDN